MARKPPKGKSLAEVNPELAKQWHPTKNGDLTHSDVTSTASKKVWWKCGKGDDHEWEATIVNRSKGSGCSICSGHKVAISTS
ncbi:MAG: zinc-ribbon domain-containing protein, partial [Flavobacteriales bacterium]